MTATALAFITQITKERNQIRRISGSKHIRLTLILRNGNQIEIVTNDDGTFFREPELWLENDDFIHIAGKDTSLAYESNRNDNGVTYSVTTTQPISIHIIDIKEIIDWRFDFELDSVATSTWNSGSATIETTENSGN